MTIDTGDRYPSDPTNGIVIIKEQIRALQQEVAALQGRNQLNNAKFSGTTRNVDDAGNVVGTWGPDGFYIYDAAGNLMLSLTATGLRMYDAAGLTRATVGNLNGSGDYGIRVRDADNGIRFSVQNDGYHDPWLAQPWRNQQTPASVSITSGTFTTAWTSTPELINHLGVSTTLAWITDPGTTAEVRLSCDGSGLSTSAVALAAGSSGVQQFQWLHGADLGTGPTSFLAQARVTGGAGAVRLDEPMSALTMADPDQCTATGL